MALELLSPAGSPEALRAAVQSGCGAVYLGWGISTPAGAPKTFLTKNLPMPSGTAISGRPGLSDPEHPADGPGAASGLRCRPDGLPPWGGLRAGAGLGPLPCCGRLAGLSPSRQHSDERLYRRRRQRGLCGRLRAGGHCPGVLREDTAAICKACPAEIEIFGHGALCMCYSGQCEMSALIGGRSGNRGTCAQPCRLPYGFNGPAKTPTPQFEG